MVENLAGIVALVALIQADAGGVSTSRTGNDTPRKVLYSPDVKN